MQGLGLVSFCQGLPTLVQLLNTEPLQARSLQVQASVTEVQTGPLGTN